MISKYNGKCADCGQPTKAGVDQYDVETKQSYHVECREKQDLFTASESEELADRLKYRKYEWAELDTPIE